MLIIKYVFRYVVAHWTEQQTDVSMSCINKHIKFLFVCFTHAFKHYSSLLISLQDNCISIKSRWISFKHVTFNRVNCLCTCTYYPVKSNMMFVKTSAKQSAEFQARCISLKKEKRRNFKCNSKYHNSTSVAEWSGRPETTSGYGPAVA